MKRESLPPTDPLFQLADLVIQQLAQHRICTVFINQNGDIELAIPGELNLDGLSVQDALQALLARGYDDAMLEGYLKARDARFTPPQNARSSQQTAETIPESSSSTHKRNIGG